MKIINENTVIATGKEISESGLFQHIQPENTQVFLWIKWNWTLSKKESENYAPIVELFPEIKEDSTHIINSEKLYFKLPKGDTVDFAFESFISKYIKIERL